MRFLSILLCGPRGPWSSVVHPLGGPSPLGALRHNSTPPPGHLRLGRSGSGALPLHLLWVFRGLGPPWHRHWVRFPVTLAKPHTHSKSPVDTSPGHCSSFLQIVVCTFDVVTSAALLPDSQHDCGCYHPLLPTSYPSRRSFVAIHYAWCAVPRSSFAPCHPCPNFSTV